MANERHSFHFRNSKGLSCARNQGQRPNVSYYTSSLMPSPPAASGKNWSAFCYCRKDWSFSRASYTWNHIVWLKRKQNQRPKMAPLTLSAHDTQLRPTTWSNCSFHLSRKHHFSHHNGIFWSRTSDLPHRPSPPALWDKEARCVIKTLPFSSPKEKVSWPQNNPFIFFYFNNFLTPPSFL